MTTADATDAYAVVTVKFRPRRSMVEAEAGAAILDQLKATG